MALRGELPSVAKIGGVWTFDEAALRDWVSQQVVKSLTRAQASREAGAMRDDGINLEYERTMRRLRGSSPLDDKALIAEVKHQRERKALAEARRRLKDLEKR